MGDLEKAGLKNASKKTLQNITEKDALAIFRLCDSDKSGSISEKVSVTLFLNISHLTGSKDGVSSTQETLEYFRRKIFFKI